MRARIYQPARTAMQSGVAKTHHWVLEFAPASTREVDPLMGWTSSGDTQAQVRLQFDTREAAVRQALTLTEPELRAVHGDQIAWHSFCEWSRREGRVLARRQERFGALVLADQPWPDAPPEAMARAALEGLRQIGLTFTFKDKARAGDAFTDAFLPGAADRAM
jgi:hypothetical protein